MYVSTEFCLTASKSQPHRYAPRCFKDWVDFFFDCDVSQATKTQYAEQYLTQLLPKIDTAQVAWLDHPHQVHEYLLKQHHEVCRHFQDYVARRKQNGSREYFATVSHAFEFLYRVAPTKLVDGSWLYSTLSQYNQTAVRDLVHIYLEELGLGHRQANHVTMYQDLLKHYELSSYTEHLDDAYYEQAAVQLALAYAPSKYLPIVIGFNLGYEQLPLHLLITNYELAELGIDPQYFNVHITIDNAHNGHAQKSLQAFLDLYRTSSDPKQFLEMVKQGYLMNDRGKSSTQIIDELNLDQQVLNIFQNKALVGQYIHNQKCQLSGKTINEWLSHPEQIQEFLNLMIEKGWIQRGQAAEHSRFWTLIDAPNGRMFGVFNATEKQFIRDWIQGALHSKRLPIQQMVSSHQPHDHRQHMQEELKSQLRQCLTAQEKIEILVPFLAPHKHDQPLGLWATQQLAKILFPFQTQALNL